MGSVSQMGLPVDLGSKSKRYDERSRTWVNVTLTHQQKGHGGKWKTTHQQTKDATQIKMGKSIDVGDQGLWVTYARGMKVKAVKEFTELCFEVKTCNSKSALCWLTVLKVRRNDVRYTARRRVQYPMRKGRRG